MPPGIVVLDAIAVFDDEIGEALLPFELNNEHPPPAGPADLGSCDQPQAGGIVVAPVSLVSGWLRVDQGFDQVEIQFGDAPKERVRIVLKARERIRVQHHGARATERRGDHGSRRLPDAEPRPTAALAK